jgi:hypothetical protein
VLPQPPSHADTVTRPAVTVTNTDKGGSRPFYKTWWFWTTIVVVAGGTVAAVVATRGGTSGTGATLGDIHATAPGR